MEQAPEYLNAAKWAAMLGPVLWCKVRPVAATQFFFSRSNLAVGLLSSNSR